MLTRKRIVFVLALAAATFVSAIAVATVSRKPTSAAPLKIRLLRNKDKKHVKPTAAEIAAHKAQNERKLKVKEFKDMPVAIKEVRNLQSDTWYKDLEIEVKNVSSKPIYSILAYLKFPDVNADPNRVSGVTLEFGLRKYIDIRVVAHPLDPHVKPGDTCVLKIGEQYLGGLRWKQENIPEKVRKFELKFAVISFGDETGFAVESPSDHRVKKSRSHHGKTLRSPPQDGCGSCSRYIDNGQTAQLCWDFSQHRACDSRVASTSPTAPCRLTRALPFDCDNDGIEECYHDEIYSDSSCPGYSPTPTPTPSPSPTPTPSPSPTPTPCPAGSFDPDQNGNCPSYANKVNGCCICQQTTDCSNFGQGTWPDGSPYCIWVEHKCDCYNIDGPCRDNPRPSETPTPTPEGGYGGPIYDRDCVDYYYVYFYSYDGGNTWHYSHSEYAGCWDYM